MKQTLGKRNTRGISTVLGTMEFGRRATLEESTKMVEHFKSRDFKEIDTAAMYSGGQTEEFLGQMPEETWKSEDNKMNMATKINAWQKNNFTAHMVNKQTDECLARMQTDSCDIMYLHSPDHKTKLTETLKACDKLHKAGKFRELGLSNYSSWQVAEVVNLCKTNKWVVPTVYQGMYSAITREVEKELFPCLKFYGIRFYAYSPLGGGILTGKWKFENAEEKDAQPNTRFFGASPWTKIYRDRYWHGEHFEAIENLKGLLKEIYPEENITIAECAYRWMYHHSALKDNDAVIVGASSLGQLEMNLDYTDKPALDARVVEFFEAWWKNTSHLCPVYFR